MLLEGDDDLGTFCILVPQPMDRSMKKLQAWRLYEVKNGGDGSKFDNKFFLFTLRYTNNDIGTLETVLATLSLHDYDCKATRPVSRAIRIPPAAELASNAEHGPYESDESLQPIRRTQESQKRKSRSDSKILSRGNKRKRKGVTVLPFSKKLQDCISKTKPMPNAKGAAPTSNAVEAMGGQQPLTLGGSITSAVPPDSSTLDDFQNIDIVWTLSVDGEECDFPLTMAKCKSLSEVLEAMQGMAGYFAPADAVLDKTTLWRLTYTLPDGTKRTQMALKETKVAFNRMQIDLRQAHLFANERLDVEIRAIG
jgi:hypothetical protein